jgi:hypothetical protein
VPLRVLIFCDANEMLSQAQCEAIQALIPGLVRIIPWDKSQGLGAVQIAAIWKAYQLAAGDCDRDDFVVRVDSDVFFFSDWVFRIAARSRMDVVGDGHYVGFKFPQGGLYFIRAAAVNAICRHLEQNPVAKMLEGTNINADDVALSHFARTIGLKTWLTFFMMFPDEYQKCRYLTSYQRWKFSCLHFTWKNKSGMLAAYEKDILRDEEAQSFHEAIQLA